MVPVPFFPFFRRGGGAADADTAPDLEAVSRVNRAAWNEAAAVHADSQFARLLAGFERPDFSTLNPLKRETLLAHGLAGKSVLHLCCNNGRDLLSIKRLGAGRCVGVDLSDEFIAQGRRLAAVAGKDVELVQADVYALDPGLDGQFDIALVTAGTLRGLPDLRRFFAVAARVLAPSGWLFVHEMHPLVDVFSLESSRRPGRMRHSYFRRQPYVSRRGLDYYRVRAYRARPCYRFHHKLSDVVQAVIDSGLVLESLTELRHDVSGGTFAKLERAHASLPLSYTLTARRRA
jgi:ubiquinone/menaquinone biosynthesis C-methylase UbiE